MLAYYATGSMIGMTCIIFEAIQQKTYKAWRSVLGRLRQDGWEIIYIQCNSKMRLSIRRVSRGDQDIRPRIEHGLDLIIFPGL